MILKIENRLYS